jgi:hypothetical protein
MSLLSLPEIRQRLVSGAYNLSDHALVRVVERNISSRMIQEAGANAEVIEDYPEDKYGPSCLLLGFTATKTPMHIQVSRLAQDKIKIITLYVPNPDQWIDHRIRKELP